MTSKYLLSKLKLIKSPSRIIYNKKSRGLYLLNCDHISWVEMYPDKKVVVIFTNNDEPFLLD